MIDLTPASLALFKSLVEDAPNWSGTPAAWGSAEDRGNLTDLKVKGPHHHVRRQRRPLRLVHRRGQALAAELGYDPQWLA